MELFAQNGFEETTVEEIAEAAGVSRRSFFRYFSSKNDLMAHGIVNYATILTSAIQACPPTYSLFAVVRETVLQVARQTAAHPRTRKVMRVATESSAAREAHLSRTAELQERVAKAFAQRGKKTARDHLTPGILAGLTLSVLGVTFQSWFEQEDQDITATAEQALATLRRLICNDAGPDKLSQTSRAANGRQKQLTPA